MFQSTIEEFAQANKTRPKLMQENAALRAEKESLKQRLTSLEGQIKEIQSRDKGKGEELSRLNILVESKYKPMEKDYLLFKEETKSQVTTIRKEKELLNNRLNDSIL